MIRLDTTTRTLEIILTAAQTTNPMACAVCYSDDSPGISYTGGSKLTSSNGLTAATMCLAPAAGVTRDIDFISVYNADTAQKQATIRINDNGTFYSLVDVIMNVDDRLEYTHGSGWKLTDINGQTKQTFIGGSMTSAQLAAIITDETGSGALVFATGSTIAPSSINGVTTDSTTNKPLTAATGAAIGGNSSQAFSTAALSATGAISSTVQIEAIGVPGINLEAIQIFQSGGFSWFDSIALGTGTARPIRFAIADVAYATLSTSGISVTGSISATTTIKSGGYTVATLPAGTTGDRAYVTDATAPTWNGALTGGGAVVVPVFKNATVWVSA